MLCLEKAASLYFLIQRGNIVARNVLGILKNVLKL
jgi:hypothetical protein